MAKAKTATTAQPKPISKAREKQLAIADINAQVQTGKLSPEDAQAQIDELNGIVREVDDDTGNVTVTDANLTDNPPTE